ncbi:MAG: baseplate J/gp47 family protein [Pseudomonadales bacterium]|nr:baseplate J/gp47 family protein [Pseudomonadales bacterium]
MSFRRRTYPELLENVLTGLIGGVAAESHAYPPLNAKSAPYAHALENPPVDTIISVYGVRNNQSVQFIKDTDYQLDSNKLVWLEEGNTPDMGSVFHINYRTQGASSPFNDLHVGSVLRTLAESFSLEMAGLYAQAEAVYKAGFVDTAEGRSLDNVVSLLGIQRVKAGRNSTKLKFARVPGTVGDIYIPAGTRVANEDASVQYETIESVTLLNGQGNVQVSARDLDDNIDALEANTLIILVKPIVGIESVTNPNPSQVLEQDETDDHLRTRSKNFLHGSEKATLGAIKQAIAQQNIVADVEENIPAPGHIQITLHTDDTLTTDLEKRLRAAIREVRPAGIKIGFAQSAAPYPIDLEMRITTVDDLLSEDLRALQEEIDTNVSQYINSVELGTVLSVNKMIGLVLNNPSVSDVRILSITVAGDDVWEKTTNTVNTDLISGVTAGDAVPVTAGTMTIIDPALATSLTVTVSYPIASTPPSEAAIQGAMQLAIEAVNELNDSELPDSPTAEESRKRELAFGKFLAVTPLPSIDPSVTYNDIAGSEVGGLPTAASMGDYTVRYVVTSESGLSHILDSEASPTVGLIPYERLTLAGVELKAKAEVPA